MTKPEDIGWGSYRQYEGPFFRGSVKYLTPANPSDAQKRMAVLTATESGRYDAVNMYDRMIISVGIIQWGEAGQFKVSDLIGEILDVATYNERDQFMDHLASLGGRMDTIRPLGPKPNRTRFRIGPFAYDTLSEQQQFWLSCSGRKGSWSASSRAYAKTWAAVVANLLATETGKQVQEAFCLRQLDSFISDRARSVLSGHELSPMLLAAYLSYAANLPETAEKYLLKAVSESVAEPWSDSWIADILGELTYGAGIAIYPIRYDAIRPVLEKHYGVRLPTTAKDLPRARGQSADQDLWSPEAIQRELIACGIDLGPKGADGVFGPKTKAGVRLFQFKHGLEQDGIVGPKTLAALRESARARETGYLPSTSASNQ